MIYSMIDIRHMAGIQISIFHECIIYSGFEYAIHMVILYCATSIAMNMKGRRSASRDIKHWIMHNSYICRPPKTFSFEVFEDIKINFFVPSGHKSGHKIFYKMKRTIE